MGVQRRFNRVWQAANGERPKATKKGTPYRRVVSSETHTIFGGAVYEIAMHATKGLRVARKPSSIMETGK